MIDEDRGPFKLPALKRLATIVGDTFTGEEITELFRKAGWPEIVHYGSAKWRFLYKTFEDLQKRKFGWYAVIRFIEAACDPQEYFDRSERHQSIINDVNKVLGYYSIKMNKDGKVFKINERQNTIVREGTMTQLSTLRGFHPEVIKHAEKKFSQKNYFDVVDECCKAFEKYVKEKSNVDKHGSKLMSAVLSSDGTLKLNPNKTETEKSQQQGLMHLCMGLMIGIRNPIEHEPQLDFEIQRHDALDILSFISYLYRQIDKCNIIPNTDL